MIFITKEELESLSISEINVILEEASKYRTSVFKNDNFNKDKLIELASTRAINKSPSFKVLLETSIAFGDDEAIMTLIENGITFKKLNKTINLILKTSKVKKRLPFTIIREIIDLFEIFEGSYSLANNKINFIINKLIVIATFRKKEYEEMEKKISKKKS